MFRQNTSSSSSIKFNRFALFAGVTAFSLALLLIAAQTRNVSAVTTTFSFGASGDHGKAASAQGVFKAIGAQNLDLFQNLGDLSYDGSNPETEWCQLVKDNINSGASLAQGNTFGENFPFMMATGNHESAENSGGQIEDFVANDCLPNRLAGQTTLSTIVGSGAAGSNYAKEYYYDYPAVSPIARFIIASPGLDHDVNGVYSYASGSSHYNWVSNAIDSARTAGIKWVIAVNHENYITTGTKSDTIGSDYFNLLVDKKVDLILQGHDHTYQRSKQLALSAGCPDVPKNTTDADCIVDDGLDNAYTKGNGPVLVIAGNGGYTYYDVNSSDSEAGYFANIMGNNSANKTHGFVKFTVSDASIASSFVPGIGIDNGFTDSFSITQATPPPTPPSGGESDTTAPAVSLTAPAANATLSASANLAATASDAVGVTKVEFYANATKLGTDTTEPYSFTWDTTVATNGNYALTAKGYDAAGNVAQSSAVAVTVANGAPTTFTVGNKDGVTQSSITLGGTCTTNAEGSVASVPSQFNNKTVVSAIDFSAACSVAGGTAQVTIDLGKKYETLSALKVHKDQSDKTIKDITSEVTIENRTIGDKTTTYVVYSVKDGEAGDTDGAVNSNVDDPVYVLDESTTVPNTPAELAETGIKLFGLVSLISLLVAAAIQVMNRDKRFYAVKH